MKALKIIGNIFGILFAIVLSIVLVAVLIVSPVVTAASDFVKPETIREVITNIDYETILVDSNIDLEESMGEYGIPAEAITEIMKSDAVGDVVELYVKELEAAIGGDTESDFLTADAIKQIAGDNIDDLIDIAFNFIPESEIPEDITVEEVKQQVETALTEYINENAEEIVTYLPDPKEIIVEVVDTQVIETIRYVQNGTFTTALWTVIAVLSLLILGCRWPRFKGFMWLGVLFFLGTIITFALNSVLNTALLDMIMQSIPDMDGVITPAMSVVAASVTKVGIILAVLTVVFIAVFVVGRVFLAKKKKAAATVNYAPVSDAPVAEETEPAQETVVPTQETVTPEETPLEKSE